METQQASVVIYKLIAQSCVYYVWGGATTVPSESWRSRTIVRVDLDYMIATVGF
jgi:hypothetical protein